MTTDLLIKRPHHSCRRQLKDAYIFDFDLLTFVKE